MSILPNKKFTWADMAVYEMEKCRPGAYRPHAVFYRAAGPQPTGDHTTTMQNAVADPAMGGPGAPPTDQNLGLVVAARSSLPHTRGQVFV